nr:FYDLN acid domain-containing protein [Thermoanaerobaculia bacterium]
MPDLGTKWKCFECETKFYDFGKPEALCPKC